MDLRGKRICITGASYGIGFELAKILLARGAIVHSIARSPTTLESPNLFHYQVDLCKRIPGIAHIDFDILIMNVAVSAGPRRFDDLSYAEIERTIYLNMMVHMRLMKELRHKKVVFIDSVASMSGIPCYSLYCATKAFISTLNEALVLEGKDTYIIYPYKVNTQLFREMRDFMTLNKVSLAETIVSDIEKGVRQRTVPCIFRTVPLLKMLLPISVWDFILKILIKLLL